MEHREFDIKKAYNQLLEFELELHKQEAIRKELGSPFGRPPPFKFSLTSSSSSKILSPNYAAGLARHPFLITESLGKSSFSSSLSCRNAPKKKILPKLNKFSNKTPDVDLPLSQKSQQLLKCGIISKFPSNLKEAVEKVLNSDHEMNSLYETPLDSEEYNPFLRPKGKNYFFPLEMFYEEEVNLQEILYPVDGFSLYNNGNSYEWKPCKILKYNQENGKFFIRWDEKNQIKETSRHTVRFSFEDEQNYLEKMENAKVYRVNYEAGIRYLARLELETYKHLDSISLPVRQEKKIISKIGQEISQVEKEEILDEIRKNYIHGVVEFSFKIEHFLSEAKKLEKPWKIEMEKKEMLQIAVNSYKHTSFNVTSKKLKKLLSLDSLDMSVLKEVFHKIQEISFFRLYCIIIDLSQKEQAYEEKRLKWVIKDWYTELKIKIDKIVKKSLKLFKQHENLSQKILNLSQASLESNLQVSVYKSTEDLMDYFHRFYPCLPYQNFKKKYIKCLSSGFILKKRKYSQDLLEERGDPGRTTQESEDMDKLLYLITEDISETINKGFYLNYKSPAPLLKIQIISKVSLMRQARGRKFKLFSIYGNAELNEGLSARHGRRINTEYPYEKDLVKSFEIKRAVDRKIPLLTDLDLSWCQINYDKSGMFITPPLSIIEESLRDIIKAPLKFIEKIRSLNKSKNKENKLVLPNSSECYQKLVTEVQEIIKYSFLGPMSMLNILSKYDYLVKESLTRVLSDIIGDRDYEFLHAKMKKIKKDSEEVEALIPPVMNFGIFQLDLQMIKLEIKNNANEILQAILEEIEKEKIQLIDEAHTKFHNLTIRLVTKPNSVEELVDLRKYIENQGDLSDYNTIKSILSTISSIIEIMDEFYFCKIKDYEEKYWITRSWPVILEKNKSLAIEMIEHLYPHFQLKLKEQLDTLNTGLDKVIIEINDFSKYDSFDQAEVYYEKSRVISDKLKTFLAESQVINSREIMLSLAQSDFSKITHMIEDFKKYNKIWKFIKNWNEKSFKWMDYPFKTINPKEFEDTIREGFSLLRNVEKKCESDIVLMSVAFNMQAKLNIYEKYLPIVFCLRDRSIQARHWKEIWKILNDRESYGYEEQKIEYCSLKNLLDKGINHKLLPIAEIAVRARHEYKIERIIVQIEADLNARMTVVKYEECEKIDIVKDIYLIIDAIREHTVNLKFLLKNAKYAEYYKKKIKDLIAYTGKLQLFLEDLASFQEKWKEIYPLFMLPVMPT